MSAATPGPAAADAPDDPIVVTGLGLATALGFGVESVWRRLLAGDSAIANLPPERFALPITLPVRLGAEVPREEIATRIRAAVPRGVWNTSAPVCHLWLLAALEALVHAGLRPAGESAAGKRSADEIAATAAPGADGWAATGIYVGSGAGAQTFAEEEYIRVYTAEKAIHRDVSRFAVPMYMASALAGQLSMLTGARGPALAVNTACSSGATALLAALDALRLGRIDRALAGGVDLTLSAAALKGFANLSALSTEQDAGAEACRPFDARRTGFVLGEGAACLVLERASLAARRGAQPLAVLAGGAANAEAHHLLAPRDEGPDMAACMAAALRDADVAPDRVVHVYAHGTGTRYNDACEATALGRVLPHAPTVSATKAQLGHTLGAAAAIDAVLAVHSLRTGAAPTLSASRHIDPACPVHAAERAEQPRLGPQGGADRTVLVNAFAFGGHNATLLLAPAPGTDA